MSATNRLKRRGQKKVSNWFPASIEPVFTGWYDVWIARQHRVRLYWSKGDWFTAPSGRAFPFHAELRRRHFEWRGIDRTYYSAELK